MENNEKIHSDIIRISLAAKTIEDKLNYYRKILDKYGFELPILSVLNPISNSEQETLINNLSKDKYLIDFLLDNIYEEFKEVGLELFYNAIYFNIAQIIIQKLDIKGLELRWNKQNLIKKYIPLNLYINNTYYGDLDVFNKGYSMANPTRLIEIIKKVKGAENLFNEDSDEINSLYSKITNPPRKTIFEKTGIISKDPLANDKKRYAFLLEKKYRYSLNLDNLKKEYDNVFKEFTDNRTEDDILNNKLKELFQYKLLLTESFPTIETYFYKENSDIKEENIVKLENNFKYNE